jgi:histidinol phosphatase-like enzyme
MGKKYVFDLDGTICNEMPTFEKSLAIPDKDVVDKVNELYYAGNFITIYTARGWAEYNMTKKWLETNNVNHNLLICGKPIYDVWVDDKACNIKDWK